MRKERELNHGVIEACPENSKTIPEEMEAA
jgi:hypothetical protein